MPKSEGPCVPLPSPLAPISASPLPEIVSRAEAATILYRERERKIEYERGAEVPGQCATTAVQSDTGSTGGASERRTTALPAGTLRIQNVSVFDGEMGGERERRRTDLHVRLGWVVLHERGIDSKRP